MGLSDIRIPNRKAMASLVMLTSWTLWNERNARVFHRKCAPPAILLSNIMADVAIWVVAGAKKNGYHHAGRVTTLRNQGSCILNKENSILFLINI